MGFWGKLLLKNGAIGGTAKVSSELYNLNESSKISHEDNLAMILERRVKLSMRSPVNLLPGVASALQNRYYDDLPFLVFLICLYESATFRNNFSTTSEVAKDTLDVIYEVIEATSPTAIRLNKVEFIETSISTYRYHISHIKQLERINTF